MYREARQQPACGRVSTLTRTLERMMTQAVPINLIRWHYLWYVALALVVMIAAIISRHLWFLNFLHVFSGLLWTGIDLFMGLRARSYSASRRTSGAKSRALASDATHAVSDADTRH